MLRLPGGHKPARGLLPVVRRDPEPVARGVVCVRRDGRPRYHRLRVLDRLRDHHEGSRERVGLWYRETLNVTRQLETGL